MIGSMQWKKVEIDSPSKWDLNLSQHELKVAALTTGHADTSKTAPLLDSYLRGKKNSYKLKVSK